MQGPPSEYGGKGSGDTPGPPADHAPPTEKGLSGFTVALIVVGTAAVLGFGSCALCVGLGARAVGKDERAPHPTGTVADIHDLLRDYKGNTLRADAAWKGKWIQTRGVLEGVQKDVLGGAHLTIGTGALVESPRVQCELSDEAAKKAATLSKDTLVTVRGRVDGLMVNVILGDCEVVP